MSDEPQDGKKPAAEGDDQPPSKAKAAKNTSENGGETHKTKSRPGGSPALNLIGDLLDKLTDVLNFGRILSIGIPGFVAAYGLLMLLSLFSAPLPTRWVITNGVTSDTVDIMAAGEADGHEADSLPAGGPRRRTGGCDSSMVASVLALRSQIDSLRSELRSSADSTDAGVKATMKSLVDTLKARLSLLADSSGKTRTTVLAYYEQSHGVRVLSFIDRSRFRFDSQRLVTQWYFWLIGAILVGSLISQWGYRELTSLDARFRFWQRIIDSTNDAGKKHAVAVIRPWNWGTVRKALKELAPADKSSAASTAGQDQSAAERDKASADTRLWTDFERERYGCSNEPSWSTMHLPLLRQNMVASQGITYWDHLTKEYWRHAEFAVNCPAAVILSCLSLGTYFLSLSLMYHTSAWQLGLILVALGLGVGAAAVLWWNPTIAFASFNHYRLSRAGLIAGLSLFPMKKPDVDNPLEGMYTGCTEFRDWYCKRYQEKLAMEETGPRADDARPCRAAPNSPAPENPAATAPSTGEDDRVRRELAADLIELVKRLLGQQK